MADTKISALPASTTPLAGTETLPIVQSGTTKQVSVANLTSGRDVGTQALTASGFISSIGSSGLPASTGSNAYQTGGYSSPITGRLFIGDGTGWSYYFSKRNSSVNTDLYQFADSGNLSLLTGNLIQGTAAKGVNFTANTGAAGMTSQLLNWYEEGTWTPTVTSSTGTITTVGTCTGQYTRIGRQVTLSMDLRITTNGTGAGYLKVTGIPFSMGTTLYGAGVGSEIGVTGKMLQMSGISATEIGITNYDGTYPGATGFRAELVWTYFV